MQTKGLLAALGLLVLLGGAVWYSNKVEKEKADRPDPDAPPKIVEIPADQIRQIDIAHKGETTSLTRSDEGNYALVAPQALRADQDAASSLVTTLSSLASDRVVDEKPEDISVYGLDSPNTVVTVTKKDGSTVKLLIGDETPTGSYAFCKREDDPRVFTLASWNKSSLEKTWKDLRDKRLLTFDSEKLTRLEVTAKGQTIEFGKNQQNEWQIIKPRPLRADGGAVEELVRKVRDAKMDVSLTDEELRKLASRFGGATHVATVRVTDAAGTQSMEVRRTADNTYLARSDAVEGVHKVTSDIGDGLAKSLEDYRNKKLFDFGWSDPEKFSYKDEKTNLSIERKDDKWWVAGKEMDSVSVRNLIDELRDLSATKFLDSGEPQPEIELSVTSSEGKRVENVRAGKAGERWIAVRVGEPSVYELDAKKVEELKQAAAGVREAEVKKDEKKK
jgi:hypothetical protein